MLIKCNRPIQGLFVSLTLERSAGHQTIDERYVLTDGLALLRDIHMKSRICLPGRLRRGDLVRLVSLTMINRGGWRFRWIISGRLQKVGLSFVMERLECG